MGSLDLVPPKRQPMLTDAAIGPRTLSVSLLRMGSSGVKVKAGTGLDFHEPKYLSTMAMVLS